MKKHLLLFGLTLISVQTFSQDVQTKRCATVEYTHYRESKQPGYIQATKNAFSLAKNNISQKSETEYIIPVVVHIVYNNAAQNLHDSIIHNQIQILNEDFNRENADTVNMRSVFAPIVGSAKIRFQLAAVDPNGNPTNGITRTETSKTTFTSVMGLLTGDMSENETVKSTANGGIDPWNQSKYLNIWVCNMGISFGGQDMNALLGYATPPANLPNWPAGTVDGLSDGVVIQFQAFGRNNPNPLITDGQAATVKGRTVTHEVGHYLGLRHVWGDGDCSQDDGIEDTPNANDQSEFDCNTTKNTCVDNILGADLPDMVENYMDYSAEDCQNSLTKKQIELIRGVIETNRWDLVNNNPAVGIKDVVTYHSSLYPNPSNTMITLTSNHQIEGQIDIIDINGKTVQSVSGNGFETSISIAELQNGIYQITFKNNDGSTSNIRLVKI